MLCKAAVVVTRNNDLVGVRQRCNPGECVLHFRYGARVGKVPSVDENISVWNSGSLEHGVVGVGHADNTNTGEIGSPVHIGGLFAPRESIYCGGEEEEWILEEEFKCGRLFAAKDGIKTGH